MALLSVDTGVGFTDYVELAISALKYINEAKASRDELKQELTDLEAVITVVKADLILADQLQKAEAKVPDVNLGRKDEFGLPVDNRPAYIKAGELLKERLKRANEVVKSLSSLAMKIQPIKARAKVRAATADIMQSVELLRVGVENKKKALNVKVQVDDAKAVEAAQQQVQVLKNQLAIENDPENKEVAHLEELIATLGDVLCLLRELESIAVPVFPHELDNYAETRALYNKQCVPLSKFGCINKIKRVVCNAVQLEEGKVVQNEAILRELRIGLDIKENSIEDKAFRGLIQSESTLKLKEVVINVAMAELTRVMSKINVLDLPNEGKVFRTMIMKNFEALSEATRTASNMASFYVTWLSSSPAEEAKTVEMLTGMRSKLGQKAADCANEFLKNVQYAKSKLLVLFQADVTELESRAEKVDEESPYHEILEKKLEQMKQDAEQLSQMILIDED